MVSEEYVGSLSSAEKFERHFGGSPGNIAVNLKDMGVPSVLISRVGADPFGDFIIEKLKARGMDTGKVQADPVHPTTFVMVSKSKESPQFLPLRGADRFLTPPPDIGKIFEKTGFFHFSSWPISMEPSRTAVIGMITEARERGVKICFDPNYRRVLWENGSEEADS